MRISDWSSDVCSSDLFEPLSAVFSGVADLRKVFDGARRRRQTGQGTLLFVDEIHRFNRAQQDGFLPYVEDGTVVLVGATTEIGRASCRERGCHDVSIWVGAV